MKTNRVAKATASILDACVERHFELAEDRDLGVRENPFTGARFVPEFDSIDEQKEAAKRALAAKWWFQFSESGDMLALPINTRERSAIKYDSPLVWVLVHYASSWECNNYAMRHPSFDIYARGVMAMPEAPEFIRNSPELRRRFQPKPLPKLGADLVWR